jgi:hypothetical protein
VGTQKHLLNESISLKFWVAGSTERRTRKLSFNFSACFLEWEAFYGIEFKWHYSEINPSDLLQPVILQLLIFLP